MSHPVAEERPVEHGDALNVIRSAIAEAPGTEAAAQRAAELLHDRFAHYDWVGIYWLDPTGTELVLGPGSVPRRPSTPGSRSASGSAERPRHRARR